VPAADLAAPGGLPTSSPGLRATPAARRRASELGVDLAKIVDAADGVFGLREVEAAARRAQEAAANEPGAPAPTPSPAPPPAVSPSPSPPHASRPGLDLAEMRKAIASAMSRSWREIPHYFVGSTLDLTPMLDWLARENARRPVGARLHYAAPLIKAVALALKASPALNGQHGERGFEPASQVHLGIAIAMRGGGLVAPAILDADRRSLPDLMANLDDLVARVRGGRLRSSELSAATATLSNLGDETADTLQPVVYPPQVAIIGCGQVRERAWAEAGALSARRTMSITVGGDHRVSDGRIAARFLRHLDELLQHPERL
jgi:pyruvate dehydrogenase E2 component (dihydrolipoamide acetyltransferase)